MPGAEDGTENGEKERNSRLLELIEDVMEKRRKSEDSFRPFFPCKSALKFLFWASFDRPDVRPFGHLFPADFLCSKEEKKKRKKLPTIFLKKNHSDDGRWCHS